VITILQAIILGLIQGLTELFPISSLGHSVVLPGILGWNIHQNDSYFLTFLIATHLATATVLFIFFYKDWKKIISGIFRTLKQREVKKDDTYARIGWLLVIGTIPAGIIGLLFQDSIRKLFASAQIAAGFLVINGFILLGAEQLRKRAARKKQKQSDESLAHLSPIQAIYIGAAQSLALLPGISRSGSSMGGGLLAGLNNEDAARFSFLLATPVIGAAALLKLPEIFSSSYASLRLPMLVGALCAGLAAYISVTFLMKFFKNNTLRPFALYCILAGASASLYLFTK